MVQQEVSDAWSHPVVASARHVEAQQPAVPQQVLVVPVVSALGRSEVAQAAAVQVGVLVEDHLEEVVAQALPVA